MGKPKLTGLGGVAWVLIVAGAATAAFAAQPAGVYGLAAVAVGVALLLIPFDQLLLTKVKTVLECSAIVIGAMWVGNEYFYKEIYLPSVQSAAAQMTAELRVAGKRDALVAVQGVVTLTNVGKRRLYVLEAMSTVYGGRVGAAPADYGRALADMVRVEGNLRAGKIAQRHATVPFDEELSTALMSRSIRWWLEPGEQHRDTFVVYVPTTGLDALTLVTDAWVARDTDGLSALFRASPDGGVEQQYQVDGRVLDKATRKRLKREHGVFHSTARDVIALWALDGPDPSPDAGAP